MPLIKIGVPGTIPCGSGVSIVVTLFGIVPPPAESLMENLSKDPVIPPGICALSKIPPGTIDVKMSSLIVPDVTLAFAR